MTAKTTVTIEAVYPDGTDLTNRRVVVQLIHGGAGGTVDGELIAERTTVPLTGAGPWSIALYPTAAISPSGCFYRFTIDNSSPTINRDISVPSSGPVSWTDAAILLENPDPPVTVPAAVSGDPLDVLRVKSDGSGYELAPTSALGVALLAGGNTFTGEQQISIDNLPVLDSTDILGGAEFTVVSGVYDGEQLVRGVLAAVLDLTGFGVDGPPQAFTAVALYNSIDDNYILELTSVGASGDTPRTRRVTASDFTVLGTFATPDPANYQTGTALTATDAVNKKYADLLGRLGTIAFFQSLETAGTSPRFEMCSDTNTAEEWGDHGWSTPAPDDFVDGLWVRCYGVEFTTTGLPASPTANQQVYSELFSHPMTPPDGYDYGDVDAAEFARVAVWSATENRWVHRLFWEHTSTSSPNGREDFTFGSNIEIPNGIRISSLALWLENDRGDGKARCRMLLEVTEELADVHEDGTHWAVIGELVGTTTTDVETSTEPWYFGPDFVRSYMDKLEVRNGGPDGALMASPDAAVADLEADGDPFDDAQSNTWTPGTEAVVVAAGDFDGGGGGTITLTGDVTGSGTGSFTTAIGAGVIVDADVSSSAAIARKKIATPKDGLYTSGALYHYPVQKGDNRSIAPGSLIFFRIELKGPATIDALSIDVVTGAVSGTAHLYLVAASPTTGRPTTSSAILGSTSAVVVTDTSGSRVTGAFGSAYAADPDLYWGAIHAINGTATYRGVSTGHQMPPPVTVSSSSSANGLSCIVATGGGTSTTPLANLSGITFGADTTSCPIVSWRCA